MKDRIVQACSFAFPVGIWLGLLGYERSALFALLIGWWALIGLVT